jgi:hypothetical protein
MPRRPRRPAGECRRPWCRPVDLVSVDGHGAALARLHRRRPALASRIDEAKIAIAIRATGEIPGLQTAMPALDALVQGFKPGQLVIVAGRPIMGKSALVGQWLEV